jgi:hypothetical protein
VILTRAALSVLPWGKIAATLAIVVAVGAVFGWHVRQVDAVRDAGKAEVQALWDAERARQTEDALHAAKAARLEESRRATAQQGVIDEANRQTAQAHDARAASDAAAERLRQRVSAVSARCGAAPSHPATTKPSQTASSPGDLLADLHRRLDEAAGELADVADARGRAGSACEASYRALNEARSD